jgi:hypothetical protein
MASSEERANCILPWPVWPPRTITCNKINNEYDSMGGDGTPALLPGIVLLERD